MKKLILAVAVMVSSLSFAQQDYEESNAISVFTSPGSLDDGFSIGVQYEYQHPIIYVGGELYAFPELHDLSYYHAVGRFGLNHRWNFGGIEPILNTFAGVRAGSIVRDGDAPYVSGGVEAGFDVYIPGTKFYLGAMLIQETKTDSKNYSNKDNHKVASVFTRLGFRF